LCVYSEKGGIGKTFHSLNLAVALARQGKNVLLVDADPCCSLTQLVLGKRLEEDPLYKGDYGKYIQRELQPGTWSRLPRTLAESLAFWTNASGLMKELEPCYTERLPYSVGGPPGDALDENTSGVWFLPGDMDLVNFIDKLAPADTMMGSFPFLQNYPALPYHALMKTAHYLALPSRTKQQAVTTADFVVVDLSSYATPLHRSIIVSSRAIILAAADDFFGRQSLRSTINRLGQWMEETHQLLIPNACRALYQIPVTRPELLGYVTIEFPRARHRSTNASLSDVFVASLSELFSTCSRTLPVWFDTSEVSLSTGLLAQFPRQNLLAQECQQQGCAFFGLSSEQSGVDALCELYAALAFRCISS
jgi:cellulose biosynthesis protein BcsQ